MAQSCRRRPPAARAFGSRWWGRACSCRLRVLGSDCSVRWLAGVVARRCDPYPVLSASLNRQVRLYLRCTGSGRSAFVPLLCFHAASRKWSRAAGCGGVFLRLGALNVV